MQTIVGIIPARYASTRFPGKPLAIIEGKTMIRRVYEQASQAFELVYVATDDDRIANEVSSFGGRVLMTSPDHRSGTDRCAEALSLLESENICPPVILNIQGDEPFINPNQLLKLGRCFEDPGTDIATLIKPVATRDTIFNPNHVKVVTNKLGYAMYFSRSPIPFLRNVETVHWHEEHTFFKHVGIYGYRSHVLKEITKLEPSSLEVAESLEQNRWLENGYRINTRVTHEESPSIDTPEDLAEILSNQKLFS
jgi:3-deoxy-manno-octulosonate cytidylyltransferase (CMP-KDO synthetase)